ncbi:MAG TPA: glucuronate isomerase [Anaerolineae bacterium]|nr:glucuronate isomerase [Anaerolineae bacterium]HXK42951.1 glucuronate isomerase [Anaerolineae bacterium]
MLADDRLFDPDPTQKALAMELYARIRDLPIVSPHGHVEPALFSDPERRFGDPVELLIRPDHYVLRMLYSQGIPYERLLSKAHPRQTWQLFAENFYLFRGTPSGIWLTHELEALFGVTEKLTGASASRIYEQIEAALLTPEYAPRRLFQKLHIEVLATTDPATDLLLHHQALRASGWNGRIIPTFRPDAVLTLDAPGWKQNLDALSEVSGVSIVDFKSFVRALEQRRAYFKSLGATASDFGPPQPTTAWLSEREVGGIFQRALKGQITREDAARFWAHMLCEMARMSVEDGLVMQLHPAVYRHHNPEVAARFGADMGFDIPVATEYTRNLRPLLERFGNQPEFTLLLFTLDESTYTRELAPLAGAYPCIKLGPPWWFNDSLNGMRRFFDQVMETAGLYNTAGFNDDTRAFLSIPARHDVWRRASANWLAGLQVRGIIDREEAESMAADLAVGLAKKAYRL